MDDFWTTLGQGLGSSLPNVATATVVLGLMLSGKLKTKSEHDGRVLDLKEQIKRVEDERNYERLAKDTERERANDLAQRLADAADELGATAVHLLRALPTAGGSDSARR